MSLIKKILLKFKFRNLSFKYEGDNCVYHFLDSKFSYAENIYKNIIKTFNEN